MGALSHPRLAHRPRLIHPETVLEALHRAALEEGWGRHFGAYQKTLEQREKADKEVAQAVERLAGEGRYTAIRDLGATGRARRRAARRVGDQRARQPGPQPPRRPLHGL